MESGAGIFAQLACADHAMSTGVCALKHLAIGYMLPILQMVLRGEVSMASFKVNGIQQQLDVEPEMPLLWVLRDELGLTGTKFGCGVAACGACTVHINGVATRSCVTPVSAVEGAEVTTIEGLAVTAVGGQPALTAVQQAWIDYQVPQCGYCQSGMIMAVTDLLSRNPSPSDAEIDQSITNVCRCGSYPRIRKAIRSLANA